MEERPIFELVSLLYAAGVIYFLAAVMAWRSAPGLRVVWVIAITMRLITLFSVPIQEDDSYRYIWDGKVARSGGDPFLFSPSEVLEADPDNIRDKRLAALAELRDRSASNAEILGRINHPELVSIYPALVQFVFASSSFLVPDALPVQGQVVCMKLSLGAFDLISLLLLARIIARVGKSPGLLLLYAWCPLMVKEIYNSGHMDSIPTALLLLTIYTMLLASDRPRRSGLFVVALAGLAFGTAVAAKFFALVLWPLWARSLGLQRAVLFSFCAAGVFVLFQLPYPDGAQGRADTLVRFALEWEMNAGPFLWLETLLSSWTSGSESTVVIAGSRWTLATSQLWARYTMAGLIALTAGYLAYRTSENEPTENVLHRAFVCLAALFLLGPLGFPWYFAGCVSLILFARNFAWLLLPGLLSTYYLRFAFDYRYDALGFADVDSATLCFDTLVVSAEFILFGAAWLALDAVRRWRNAKCESICEIER